MPLDELFRREAVEHRRQRLYGEVVMTLPLTHAVVLAAVMAALVLLVSVLFFGTYARRETVPGWVRPDRGLGQVHTPDEGVVDTLAVSEGDEVTAGQPLMTLRLDPDRSAEAGLAARLQRDVAAERAQLQQQMRAVGAQFEARSARIKGELSALAMELEQYKVQFQVHDRRVLLGEKLLKERQTLVQQGFSPPQEAVRQEDSLLALRQAKEEVKQEMLAKEAKLASLRHEQASLPHDRQLALAALNEKLATLAQRETQFSRQSQLVLTAPISGRVVSVRVGVGETARPKLALVEIVPQGAKLQVELYAPSRASGFVAEGMPVQLQFDAFPFQKYGVGLGRVLRVSRSTIDARDLPPGLGGGEPVYRVVVALDDAGAQRWVHPLQVGMTLKADLLLEHRRIIEYLFAPLYGFARGV